MLENLPQEIIPRVLQNLETIEIGQLATLCKSLKIAAYRLLYPKEWEDNFDKPVLFYVPVFVFNKTKADQLKEWSHLKTERQALARLFYASKEHLSFVKENDLYYTVNLSPNQLIQSMGFCPENPQKNYKSKMGIDPSIISNAIYQKDHSAGNSMELQELPNPFYGSVLPLQTIKMVKVDQPATSEAKPPCCSLI